MVTWEMRLLALFDDLEQQAAGLSLEAREAEVADLSRAEYAAVDLASRLHASVGAEVALDTDAGQVRGTLARVGAGWCLVRSGGEEAMVALPAVLSVRGLDRRSRPEGLRSVTARLGLSSALRAVAEEGVVVAVWDRSGGVHRGRPVRVGADFVELGGGESGDVVVPLGAVALVRRR